MSLRVRGSRRDTFVMEASDSKQHWIPAAFLGGFSADTGRPRLRDRSIWVKEVDSLPAKRTAKNLGYERGMYNMSDETIGSDPDAFDRTFNAYERKLPSVISELAGVSGPYFSFELWMKVIIPFVAGITVRGPDFGNRLNFPNVEIQTSRWIEMTRLLAPLMAAQWTVLNAPPGTRLITNDRGYCWTQDQIGRTGFIVPIRPSCALRVMPSSKAAIGRRGPEGWSTLLPREDLSPEDVASINDHLALSALRWIAGTECTDVERHALPCETRDLGAFSGSGWPNRGGLGKHDMDWAAALKLADIPVEPEDWHPLGILSSEEASIEMITVEEINFLTITFK